MVPVTITLLKMETQASTMPHAPYFSFEPSARGMQAALPYLDLLAPAHNLESLAGLIAALHTTSHGAGDRRLAGWQTELRKE